MEYYSAATKNEIILLARKWMDLEIIFFGSIRV
jgi:predicted nucleotidyltransferase